MDSRFNNPGGMKIHNSLEISRRKEPVTYVPGPGQCNTNLMQMTLRNMGLAILRIRMPRTKTQESVIANVNLLQ